jgi:purine-binding chemotaxis protein CheW
MDKPESYVVFTIENQSYALSLNVIERVVAAAEVKPVPGAPDIILGIINIYGSLISVINTRKHLNLPARDLDPKDKFVILSDLKRRVVIVVDEVTGVIETAAGDVLLSKEDLPDNEIVEGIIKQEGNLIYKLNPEIILCFEKGCEQHF